MSNVDNLNFKVILDDKDFNTRIKEDLDLAEKLNTQLSTLLQAKVNVAKITAEEAASAKRHDAILASRAINQERIRKEAAKTAEAEEKVNTQAAKTATELEKAKKVAAETALLQQRYATEMQRTKGAISNAAVQSQRLATETQRTRTETEKTKKAFHDVAAAASRAELAQKRVADYSNGITREYNSQSRLLNELKGYALGYLSIHGVSQLLSSLVRVTGEFELQKTTLAAMLNDLNAAEGVIERIKGLAVESPFQFKELTTYAKQLSAFSVPAQELYDTTKMLADISAGLGVGVDRIVLAYGQVRSAAFLRGQEVRQFTEAGIPILDELAKQFTELEGRAVSTGEVFDRISARLVPFEMVAKVFKDMTSEGGKFYQMQEIQAETLRGKLSNLKDAYEVMLNEIGSAHSDKLKGAVDWVKDLMQNWQSVGGQLLDIIKLFGIYKTAAATLRISDTIAKFGGLAKAIKSTAAAQTLMNSALMTNPYVAVGMAITTVVLAINRHRKALNDTTWAQNEYNKKVRELSRIDRERASAIQSLINTVQDETQATIEREAALMSLKDAYPDIFAQYDIESLKLADILSIKKQISEEDAKQKKIAAYGSIGAQEGRVKALIARGASDNVVEQALALQREMEKDYLKKYVLPDVVSGLRNLSNEALKTALEDAFRKSQYNIRGVEVLEGIQTTPEYYQDLVSAIQAEIKKRQSNKLVDGWRKKVQDELTKLGLTEGTSFGLWAKDTTRSTEYVEDMIKRYKELKQEIEWVSSFDPQQAERLQKEKTAIEAIAKALKIDIANLSANKSEKEESKEEKRIKRLVDALRTLHDQYEKLIALGADEKAIKTLFKGLYPDLVKEQGEEFVTSLNYLEEAKKLIADLAKIDKEDAKKLLVDLGEDEFSVYLKKLKDQKKAYEDIAKSAEEYFNMLRKWRTEDFNLEGAGVAFDISKIVSDLQEGFNQIDLRASKAKELFAQIGISDVSKPSEEAIKKIKALFEKEFGEGSWDVFYGDFLSKGEAAFEELAAKQKEYERKIAQDKLDSLAKRYVDSLYLANNINLSDWGDKNLAQVKGIGDKIVKLYNSLDAEGIKLSESQKAAMGSLGLTLDDLIAAIKQILEGDYDNTTDEKFKKLQDKAKTLVSIIGDAASAITAMGDAVKSDYLSSLGEAIKTTQDLVEIIFECDSAWESIAEESKEIGGEIENVAKSSDVITMVAKILLLSVEKVVEGIAFAAEQQEKLNDAEREYANIMSELRRNAYSDIFGVDEMALAAENTKILTEAQKEYQDALDDFENTKGVRVQKYFNSLLQFKKLSVSDVLGNIADEQGWELYREDGKVNMDALMAYYDAYADHLTRKQRQVVDALIASYEVQNDAAAQSAEYMTSLFSSAADTIAEKMVSAFIESGDAATDLRGVVSDVASQMASDLIKTLYIMPILNQYAEELKGIAENDQLSADEKTVAALNILQIGVEQIKDNEDLINATLSKLEGFFVGEEETADIGTGIKGITEDQANLLASYLNAIRADVSYSKALWIKMDANLQKIADMLVSSPSLMEYQAQIAANTYDTAMASQAILSELRSVITSEGGDTSIRVFS